MATWCLIFTFLSHLQIYYLGIQYHEKILWLLIVHFSFNPALIRTSLFTSVSTLLYRSMNTLNIKVLLHSSFAGLFSSELIFTVNTDYFFLFIKPLLVHVLVIPLVSFAVYFLVEFLWQILSKDVEIHVLYIALITLIYSQLLSPKNSSRFLKIYFLP